MPILFAKTSTFSYFYTIKTAAKISKKVPISSKIEVFDQKRLASMDADEKDKTIVDLSEKVRENELTIAQMQAQIDLFTRLLFGQKRERFEQPSGQLSLPFAEDMALVEQVLEEIGTKVEYVRKKEKSAHKGRMTLPEHLEVVETVIEPEGDLSEMVLVGSEVTEELELTPAKFFINRIVRNKYAPKSKEGSFLIAPMPERVIDKGIAGPSLLAQILIDKYVDHLPLYRQRQRFAREGMNIPPSTIEGWVRQSLDRLEPLYDLLVAETLKNGYLQVDETTIKVLDSDKKGASHLGYYWVYHSPVDGSLFFDYNKGRGAAVPKAMLAHFKGFLQTDGYAGYEAIGQKPGISHLVCWAHARREFERALTNDKPRAEIALTLIGELYRIEAEAREQKLAPAARKELRLSQSLKVVNALGQWMGNEYKKVLPQSQIGKAMNYAISRWDQLSNFMMDGSLEIDNNLIENAIRPVALGRKNYLFAGSHEAAQRAAIIYSLMANAKKQNINLHSYLTNALKNVMTINHKQINTLLPQNYRGE